MNSHLIWGGSPRSPLNFFYSTASIFVGRVLVDARIFFSLPPKLLFFLSLAFAPSLPTILCVKVFLWVMFSLTSEFFFAPARIIFFFRSRPNNIFFSLPRHRSRRNNFFPPFCPRASLRRRRTFFFSARVGPRYPSRATADLGTPRLPRVDRTHTAKI
jgi:hypothetical protein